MTASSAGAAASTLRSLEAALRARVQGEVSFTAGARALYATDASNYRQVPLGVVIPRTIDDVEEVVRACREHAAPILPRGAGTSLAGQCCNAAVVIDMSRHLRRVLDVSPDRRTARVQPGVVLDALQRAAAPHGLMYGPDPATHGWCTLGGMIGNNSCGVHSVVAGLTADAVESLDVLTADGLRMRLGRTESPELDRLSAEPGRRGDIYRSLRALRDRHADEVRARFPRIPRRVSGYELDALLPEHHFDLARAVVGSEGTCVTVLEATVRLIDLPRARALLVLGCDDIFAAADAVMPVLEARPIGLEAIDEVLVGNMARKTLLPRERQLLPEARAWLLVEFGGDTGESAAADATMLAARLRRQRLATSATVITDRGDMASVWRIRESGLGATAFVPGEAETWEGWEDAAVPPARLGAYLRDFRRLLDRFGYHGSLYGHFGQGCVHTRTDFDLRTPAGIATYRSFIDEAADLVVAYGGSLSGEHGDGQARAALLPKMFGERLVGAFRDFKRTWDPDGLMNPGKVVDAFAPTEHLRLPGYRPEPGRTFFRLDIEGGLAMAAARCVGVGKCRKTDEGTMCPSYMATGEEQHSTRGRARLLFEMLRGETIADGWASEEVKQALDLCLACKACKSECPIGVDMATYKAEFLAHYHARHARPLRAHLFGHLDWWTMLAARAPRAVNAVAALRPLMRMLQAGAGIAPERRLPRLAVQTFQQWMARHPPRSEAEPVVLWSDTFTNYFHPEIGRAAVRVLEHLGHHVVVPPQTCCGRPLYDFGLLESAREHLEAVLDTLCRAGHHDVPIVVIEPSCFSVFADEAARLLPARPDVRDLKARAVLFDAFVLPRLRDGRPQLSGRALVHVHCHQRSLVGPPDADDLKSIGLDAEVLDAGCCGMAGAFGFDARHYEVSMRVGERALLPAVRRAPPDTCVVADGFSCREQIRHATGRPPRHLAELLADTLDPG